MLRKRPERSEALATVDKTGVYAWWAQLALSRTLPIFQRSMRGHPYMLGWWGRGSLAERGTMMHLRRTKVSGLRRNFVALIAGELDIGAGVVAYRSLKYGLEAPEESRLTAKKVKHLD